MAALPQIAPADPHSPATLLRKLCAAKGAVLLREGERSFLAAEPTEVVRAEVGEPVTGALARVLQGGPDPAEESLWVVALTYEAGRSLLPVGGGGAEVEGLPRVLALRYPAWAEHSPEGLQLRGEPRARARLGGLLDESRPPPSGRAVAPLRRDLSREAYAEAFEAVQEDLRAGRYYQLNLTSAHRSSWEGSPVAFFERLVGPMLPARAGYLDAGDFVLASASPELLLCYDPRTRQAVSGPIKGTTSAPEDDAERARLFERLVADPKERAEHIMIVDLTRNDLGRVCVPGSVRPLQLFEPLRSGPVQHLVTYVEGTLAPDRSPLDLLTALFPGGSVTGAPKIAAMRAIDRLEVAPRGFYCGALGRVGPAGELNLTLPIRTATLKREAGERFGITYPSGGGVVVGASMERELAELELKAERLRRALS